MADYSIESLENGIEACNKNIKTFEDAIQKERDTITEYRIMMDAVERKEREAKRTIHLSAQREPNEE